MKGGIAAQPPERPCRDAAVSDGKAFPAAAAALGVGVVEHESSGEIIFAPVHRAADQIHQAAAVDEQRAARRVDALVCRLGGGDVGQIIGEARTAAARG